MKDILGVEDRPLVSGDYNGNLLSSVVDSLSTKVVGGNLVKVVSWYDNESGYTQRLLELAKRVGNA